MSEPLETFMVENARIFYKNFKGAEGMYNAEGDRSFCLELDPQQAQEMEKQGWKVKQTKVRDDGDEPAYYIQVSLKYRGRNGATVRPPTLVLITSKGRTNLSETEADVLDYIDIANVDLIVRPYQWAMSGKSGVKAYLKSIYITVQEDFLELKYADVPEVGAAEQLAVTSGNDTEDIVDAESWIVDEDQPAIER